uniref:Protein CUSTOS n=1 Tax=Labrus bergylta TaxID=56723 RepID=A0A3Q3EVG1_9LABR|nr:protein CUSTOS [Labrus bergylta]
MASPSKKMVGVSEDSSSSDDEVLKRCKEAVWEAKTDKKKEGDSIAPQSKRVIVADHDHDGNELQVTKGFQTHVAKKLGSFLDNCITVMMTENSSCVDSAKCDEDNEDDEGFRLFSSSVPGQKAVDPPAPVRRRPVPSSSDSDSEMETRLKEAAVSVKDLLPSFSQPSTLSTPSAEESCLEKIKKKVAEEEDSRAIKKKKKKRKRNQEESDSAASALNVQNNGEHGNSLQEHTGVKVKRKKKRKQDLNLKT